MRSDIILLRAALRVLSAWTEQQQPDCADVEELLRAAHPGEHAMPVDELARAIIRREIERVTGEETPRIQNSCGL